MARLYIGNLPMDMKEKDLEDIFYKYGKITDMQLKMPERPPAFGFVTFEDSRDADEAVRARDGYDFDGHRLRVEMSRGKREFGAGGGFGGGGGGYGGGGGGYGGGGGGGGYGGGGGGSYGGGGGGYGGGGGFGGGGMGPPRGGGGGFGGGRQTEYRTVVTGLPQSASWQDLKDHMRKAGDVNYADVDHRGGGVVHFSNREGMDYALRKLDGSEFSNRYDNAFIQVLPHRDSVQSRSRSRSRSPPRRERERRRSRSRSPPPRDSYRGRSRSRSR